MTRVASAASRVGGVRDIHKLKIRRAGLGIYVDLHVQADPGMTLHDAHILSGMVKSAIRESVPETLGVLVHMEPFEHDEARDTGRNPPPSSRA
jgi:divalent metal cation (Fe/Co/Zn/Cd) transporter